METLHQEGLTHEPVVMIVHTVEEDQRIVVRKHLNRLRAGSHVDLEML